MSEPGTGETKAQHHELPISLKILCGEMNMVQEHGGRSRGPDALRKVEELFALHDVQWWISAAETALKEGAITTGRSKWFADHLEEVKRELAGNE